VPFTLVFQADIRGTKIELPDSSEPLQPRLMGTCWAALRMPWWSNAIIAWFMRMRPLSASSAMRPRRFAAAGAGFHRSRSAPEGVRAGGEGTGSGGRLHARDERKRKNGALVEVASMPGRCWWGERSPGWSLLSRDRRAQADRSQAAARRLHDTLTGLPNAALFQDRLGRPSGSGSGGADRTAA